MGKQNHQEKVLVIEDDASLRYLLNEKLEKEPYELLFAVNGKEGLRLFKERKPDVVLLDLWMPVMDGFEFLEKVKPKVGDPFEIVIITAKADEEQLVSRTKISRLKPGMTLLDGIMTEDGKTVIANKGQEVNRVLRTRLENYLRQKKLADKEIPVLTAKS